MKYRRLGGTGLKVSEISLGSWLTYGGYVEKNHAVKAIETAYSLGVDFFNTASRPEQVEENVKASGLELSADVLARIDDIIA